LSRRIVAKALGLRLVDLERFMGHANISTTFDLYGHLMPGGEDDALVLLDAYYERAKTAAIRQPVE
jgi:integrase